jgi:nicotinamidase-related amidase
MRADRRRTPGRRAGGGSALVVIDFFNPRGFDGHQTLARASLRAAQRTARLKARLAHAGIPALYANDNFGHWEAEFSAIVDACRKVPGPAAEIANVLAPASGDRSILKPRHSAFYGTPLEFMLEAMGTRQLILTGVSADSCIMFTAHDAYVREFKLWIPADCVASDKPAHTRAALVHMQRVLRARIGDSTGRLPAG